MRLLPAGIEEAQFKREPDGWLFTIANPWIFGRRWTYLITDAQKPALAARVRRSRYVRLLIMLATMALLIAVLIMTPSMLREPGIGIALVAAGFVVAVTGMIFVGDYLTIRPLLQGIPRTSRKFSQGDMMRIQYEAMSVRSLSIFAAIFVFATLTNLAGWIASPRASVLALLGIAFSGLFAALFGGMLIAKLRARRAAKHSGH
jgi:hypothetical protein